ncbi:MAG TPA: SsrA-binding protein SmpB [Candidatus Dormibacteraeota bacterium]|nr:SsrA-binding protein SmpB [Candidatus Dormibacteraeota bacterium]
MTTPTKDPILARNRRARFEYFILEALEAGLELVGTEVRALREGHSQLTDAYVRIERGQAWLLGVHIQPYSHGNRQNHDPARPRRLLLHRREIDHLAGAVRQPGVTLVPLDLHLRRNRVKCEIGVAKGKRQVDKRQAIATAEARRDMQRALRRHVVGGSVGR